MELPESIKFRFRILAPCRLKQDDLRISWTNDPPSLRASDKKLMEAFWESHQQDNRHKILYNGMLCRLTDFSFPPEHAKLTLGPIDFKTHFYRINSHETVAESNQDMTGLGVSSVVLTEDEQLLFIKRSESMAVNPGKLDVFGGHIDPDSHFLASEDGSRLPSPFMAIQAELMEELALEDQDINLIELIGLIVNLVTGQPELLFRCKTAQPAEQMMAKAQSARDRHEFSEVRQIANEPDELRRLCLTESHEFSPSGLGNIWVHANTM